jgi:hypothetical protein
MKTLLLTMALAGFLLPLSGCETIPDTKNENAVRVEHAMIINLKQMNGDIESVLYLDRPVWLSRYPIPNN